MTTLEITPGRLNIIARVGDDLTVTINVTQGGSAVDLSSGYTFAAAVVPNDGSAEVDFTVDDTDYATGIIVLTMADDVSDTIPTGQHSWYMDRTDTDLYRRWSSGDFIAIEYKK